MSSPNIHGIIGYTITPFSTDGQRIDLNTLGRSIDRLIEGVCTPLRHWAAPVKVRT